MINKAIEKILECRKEKPLLIILKGLDVSGLSRDNHLLEVVSDLPVDEYKKKVSGLTLMEVVLKYINQPVKEYAWVTVEEYILLTSVVQMVSEIFDIYQLSNNLFYKEFPYRATLSDVEYFYRLFFQDGEEEIELDFQEKYSEISNYYGNITYSKDTKSYYVNYVDFNLDPSCYRNIYDDSLFSSQEIKIGSFSEEAVATIELSEDDSLFNDFLVNLDLVNLEGDVDFVFSGSYSLLPNNYYKRLQLIQYLYPKLRISLISKSSVPKVIKRERDYLELLNHYWGYEKFRNLKMYREPDSFDKQTVEISQAQIIDDIVTQAELATRGESYRDIYITSSTGSGKSIMFQIPALYLVKYVTVYRPLTIIISPLIGLMNDQVDSMRRKGIDTARAIHSNTPPYEKERILSEIMSNKVDMLYLSPETLQGKSNIRDLIGERRLGLVIIDEAHIVTTWGKTFRADYWYLGIYLQKLRKQYSFPIVTFTATAVYGGKEDMYLDTRDSLNLINPIVYLGYVRRDDIILHVRSSEDDFIDQGNDYRKTKNALTARHLEKSNQKEEKVLVYFPTVRLLNQFDTYLRENHPKLHALTGKFHGQLEKEIKDDVLRSYKVGELRFVLATKAFGMGIDIPDITSVYHYAPTGSVTDYIQEIGRVARDKNLVTNGIGHAWFDFLKNDFVEVNKLHGMGAIRKYQIIEVMKKILSVYKESGNKRNLLLSSDDFKYIFEEESDNLDNKIKTILLMIEKDFASPNKLGYPPFVARPRTLYGSDIIFGSSELEKQVQASRLSRFFKKIHSLEGSQTYKFIYSIDLSGIWQEFYKKVTFADFKYRVFTKDSDFFTVDSMVFNQLNFATGISAPNKSQSELGNLIQEYLRALNCYERFSESVRRQEKYFSISDLGDYLQKELGIKETFKSRMLAQALVNSSFEYEKVFDCKFIKDLISSKDVKYRFMGNPDSYFSFMKKHLVKYYQSHERYFQDEHIRIRYHFRTSKEVSKDLLVLGIADAMGLLTYEVLGGGKPQIFIRINSVYPLERAIKNEERYQNNLLNTIVSKHWLNVALLTYLFKYQVTGDTVSQKLIRYSNFFWETIEDYFLGRIPEEVEDKVYSRSLTEGTKGNG